MAITWNTPAGDLGIITERITLSIPLEISSNSSNIRFSLISGNLPRGLKLSTRVDRDSTAFVTYIQGSPSEVKRFTTNRFVIRASEVIINEQTGDVIDVIDIKDRTFSLSVDGEDIPEWVTREGFLNVGPGQAYFVLDNAKVDFQLEVEDTDEIAGDVLEYYLLPMGGQLPPGLSLSKTGRITGFTDPVFALEYGNVSGSYDTSPYDYLPIDLVQKTSTGFDDYFYDNVTFDYSEDNRVPRRLSRIYTFAVAVSDGANTATRIFKIYVVTEEFLQADNSLLQVDTNLFQADASNDRRPIWITESHLGRIRANNYVTIFLEVYDPPELVGTITYFLLPKNPDNTNSVVPPGLELDSMTGELAGRVPYQTAVTKQYKFTVLAVNYPREFATATYNLVGDWIATRTYLENESVRYEGFIYSALRNNRARVPSEEPEFWEEATASTEKTFTVDIIGEVESAITWETASDLGTIKPNQPCQIEFKAISTFYGNRVQYSLISGNLPPGLTFLPNGLLEGKVLQFADDDKLGLTRFYERIDSINDETEDSSTGSRSFTTSFDDNQTGFDTVFKFVVRAKDAVGFAQLDKEFTLKVTATGDKTFSNLYVKAFQSKDKRLQWYDFITDATIFPPEDIYRYGDPNFGIQTDLRVLVYAGIESKEAVNYVQAMSRNHYRKRLLFGEVKKALAKDINNQEVLYEVIYAEVVDTFEKNGDSVSDTVDLSNTIKSKVLVSYDAIKVDSDIPFVSDSDHQRVFPNSIKNMRKRIKSVGERDREFLPLWMRSIQQTSSFELGYTKALVFCYAKPGRGDNVLRRIKNKTDYASRGEYLETITYQIGDSVIENGVYYTCIKTARAIKPSEDVKKPREIVERFWVKNFSFKYLDFEADRYIIDIIGRQIQDKYLAFPQRGEKLP